MFEEITNHRTPQYQIVVITKDNKQQDITQIVSDRLISLTLNDNRGMEADMLDLQLNDHDGALELPPRTAMIDVAIGWKGQPLIHKGQYSVDEIQYSGAPDTLSIRARSADLKGSLSEKKERSFDNLLLGALVRLLADEHKLKPMCAESLEVKVIKHIDQTGESDISFLTRVAQQYDAIATVKNGYLLLLPAGKGQTVGGKPITAKEIEKKSGDNYSFSIAEGNNYKAVRAYWHNTNTGKRGEIIVDENSKIEKKNKTTKKGKKSKQTTSTVTQTEPITSDNDQIKTLRHTYESEARAILGAKAAFDKLKRGVATFTITLAHGEPELIPETPINLKGFKKQIDGSEWLITTVTHNISDGGFTTALEMELKVED